MDRKSWITLALVLVGGGVAGYGTFTNTGPAGWLNLVQQRVFGSYYPLMSFLVVSIAIMAVGAWLWDLVDTRILRKKPDGVLKQVLLGPERPSQGTQAGVSDKTVFVIYATFIGLTWAAGVTYQLWNTRSLQEDATAAYDRVDLTDGQPLPATLGSHIELRGIPITESTVVQRSGEGSSSYDGDRLVAVVGVGWTSDHAVPFVLTLGSGDRLPEPSNAEGLASRDPREVRLLVRRQGTVPVPAIAVFREMRAPLAPDVVMVRLVETRNGQPVLPDGSSDWTMVLVICGGLTGVMVVLFFAARHGARRYRRSLAAG